jgi:hypothetical protein
MTFAEHSMAQWLLHRGPSTATRCRSRAFETAQSTIMSSHHTIAQISALTAPTFGHLPSMQAASTIRRPF